MSEQRTASLRGAIVTRMRAEGAIAVDDAEITRTLAPCVAGLMLVEAARQLRDGGRLSDADLGAVHGGQKK